MELHALSYLCQSCTPAHTHTNIYYGCSTSVQLSTTTCPILYTCNCVAYLHNHVVISDSYIQGGFRTRDEMCYAFLVYYPRIEMSLGVSIITEDDFRKYLGTLP